MLWAATYTSAFDSYHQLSRDLADQVEWMDQSGSQIRSKQSAEYELARIAQGLDASHFSLRHQSNWKNGERFKIIMVDSDKGVLRIYFHCQRGQGTRQSLHVTKIKITKF